MKSTPYDAASDALRAAALRLNNAHADDLSPLEPASFDCLARAAYAAWIVAADDASAAAVLIALADRADYDSPNFRWFAERADRFVYIDRVVVAETARGRGLARTLYDALAAKARGDGYPFIGCEVNVAPPNPASHAFHAAQGFEALGDRSTADGAKTVRYYRKAL